MKTKYQVEDLGPQAHWDTWLGFRLGRNPKTGAEVAICALSRGGFMVIDPKTKQTLQAVTGRFILNGGWWAVGQAPDGGIYQAGVFAGKQPAPLLRWDWDGPASKVVAELPGKSFFMLDVAPDGRVYLPDASQNVMYRYDPQTAKVESLGDYAAFGAHIRNVYCAKDGWVYVTCTDYRKTVIVGLDPRTGEKSAIDVGGGGEPWARPTQDLAKDAAGHVLTSRLRWGQRHWLELAGGRIAPIDPYEVRLANGVAPLAFSDGGYIQKIEGRKVSYVDPTGQTVEFEVDRKESALRIFSVHSGGGKIWGGTFIPLTLFSYDPATGKTEYFGNPTETDGEIYSMVFSEGKLFMGSYVNALLTRYWPGKPWKKDKTLAANPAHLGRLKEEGPSLHRPYGGAKDARGTVYFSALGDYGTTDSGISRIDPKTEEVTRWIYPNTVFGVMIYLPQTDQLLVTEQHRGDKDIRLTFVCPATGKIVDSRVVITDEGGISSLLTDGRDWIYGLHAHRATLFAYSLKEQKIVARLPEMGLGDNCMNCLTFGPDGRIWGLTTTCVFAAERDLSRFEKVVEYEDHAGLHSYRFGLCLGPDGNVYFPNGPRLMRVVPAGSE